MAYQHNLFCAQSEAELFHDHQREGYFSLLIQHQDKKRQSSYPLSEMPKVLQMVDPSRDTWLSQGEFFAANRRVVNLARIGLLFADLDTYREPWSVGRNPEQLASTVLFLCREEGVPPPSLLVYSGRGIQAKWLLDHALPSSALPRWNACQRYLTSRLAELGADPAARDASRVLRLVSTVNSRSGEICRVVHVETGNDGQPLRYPFEYLAEILLPVARKDIETARQASAERRSLTLMKGAKQSNLRGFSGQQLCWDRLGDLRKLAELRGGIAEGSRMLHLFWRLNFLLMSGAVHSSQMYREAEVLARELNPGWSFSSPELMTLYKKAKAHEAGERVELNGRYFSPLYTPRNDTLITLLAITQDEQQHLRTILCRDIAKERDRERQTIRRRAAGAIERADYEACSISKQKPWEPLGISRASWYRHWTCAP